MDFDHFFMFMLWFRAKVYKIRKKLKIFFFTLDKKIIENFEQTVADV